MRTKATLAVRLFTRVTKVTRVDSPKTLIELVYGQLVLLPTRTESTRTFSLVKSYFFATRTLVNSYFFFGQIVLFFGQLVLFEKNTYDMLCYFITSLLVP